MLTNKPIGRMSGALAQGKSALVPSPLVAPCAASRLSRRRAQPFKGSRRLTVRAAAEAADPAPTPAPRQRRQNRPVSVDISTLQAGQEFEGTVTSVEAFGAFVDFGAASNGLVHISQLTDGFVKNAADVVKSGDIVRVKVLSVDAEKNRIALTMKGMGFVPTGAAAAAAPADMLAGGPADEEDGDAAGEDEFIQGYDVVLEGGLVFRDDALYQGSGEGEAQQQDITQASELDEGYDPEADDLEMEADNVLTLAGEMVNGVVTAADDMGVTVEFEHQGQKLKGILRIEDLLVPAAEVEALEAAEGITRSASVEGGEDEFLYDAYEDIGGVEDASKYYKAGQEVTLFAMSDPVNPERVQLFQFNPLDDDGLEYDEDGGEMEEVEDEGAELLDRLEAQAAEDLAFDDEEEGLGGLDEDDPLGLQAEVFALQSKSYPTTASTAFVNAKGDIAPTPIFPNRPMRLMRDTNLSVPQSNSLSATDDAGEEYPLVDYWSLEGSGNLPNSVLKKLGYKLVKDEESGEWEAVPRERKEGEADPVDEMDVADLLNWVDEKDVEMMVNDIMGESDDLPALPTPPARQPVVAAAAAAPAPAEAKPAAAAQPEPAAAAPAPAAAEAKPKAAAAAPAPAADASAISAADVKALRTKTGAGMMDCKKALKECGGDTDKAMEWLRQKGLSGADKKAGRVAAEGTIVRYIHPGSRLGVLLEVNCETDFVAKGEAFQALANELAMVTASCDAVCVSVDDMPADLLEKERQVEMGKEDLQSKPEAVRAKIVEGRLDKIKRNYALLEQPALRDNAKTVGEIIKETIAATGENIQVRRFVKYNLGEGLEKKSNDFAAEVAQQTQAKAPAAPKPEAPKEEAPKVEEPKKPAVAVSASEVKALRDKSGAGMMDCKKALAECGGDVEAASEWLRKKGLASADKKSGRLAAEGAVMGYIHPGSRLGVLLEVNCETDFVARSEPFLALVNSLAMQIAASPSVEYVNAVDIPAEVFAAEQAIEMGREDLQSKPEAIRAKIAEGRVKKLVQERVLLDQPYLMDDKKTVGEAIKEAIAAIGENIQVRRFGRFVLGEGIEKKSSNLAEEVAAATGAKA